MTKAGWPMASSLRLVALETFGLCIVPYVLLLYYVEAPLQVGALLWWEGALEPGR